MEEKDEPTAERKSGAFWIVAYWAVAILLLLLLYFLSVGPAMKFCERGLVPQPPPSWLANLYYPFDWAYDKPLLHKPIGMYLHLWSPQSYDKNGDETGL